LAGHYGVAGRRRLKVTIRAQNILGECPLWDVVRNGLWWLDLKRNIIGFWELDAPSHRIWPAPGLLGSAALRVDGRLLVAGSALWNFDPTSDAPFTEIAPLPAGEPSTNRFNDGRVDHRGRFVVGTMDNGERHRSGSLYRLTETSPDSLAVETLWSECGIPNGACASPDGSESYWADSWDPTLYRYDPNEPLATRVPFAQVDGGGADGACVDADGHVWLAHWDGWKLSRFRPDGSLERTIPLPVQRPTCPTFGGPDLATLYVTSASFGLTDDQRRAQPLAGEILALPVGDMVGVAGLPEHRFGT
jgi:L-arabinonolactonase